MKAQSSTWQIMLSGFLCAFLVSVSFYAAIFQKNWEWAHQFPLSWLCAGTTYMGTFFHEIGHTVFAWYYGFLTIPIFDFKHGGGYALMLGGQNYLILGCVYAAMIYGIIFFRGYKILQILIGLAFVFNLATAFHQNTYFIVIDFMGPAFEPLIGAFLLIRALFDLAPRGWFERFLNAFFGFGLIFFAIVDSYALINNPAHRQNYYLQKSAHGAGDFDKINDRQISIDFNEIVMIHIGLCLICLVIPCVIAIFAGRKSALSRPSSPA